MTTCIQHAHDKLGTHGLEIRVLIWYYSDAVGSHSGQQGRCTSTDTSQSAIMSDLTLDDTPCTAYLTTLSESQPPAHEDIGGTPPHGQPSDIDERLLKPPSTDGRE
jgi:hypothetical protein